jgi:hypothetical protein
MEAATMRKTNIVIIAAGLALACGCSALALMSEYPPGPVSFPNGPPGLNDLLKSRDPVYGYFLNEFDSLYYSGDTEAFNAFVALYSKVKVEHLTLVLECGRGEATRMGDKNRTVSYDWMLGGCNWGVTWSKEPMPQTAGLQVWLGGQVHLDKIKVPLNVVVKSGGEIEKFIADHEAARAKSSP